ncbi:MAG: hypothetical protein J6R82_04870 [Clostridia bacterium]|nr:hypothetical protein [Clostridia bacterium]
MNITLICWLASLIILLFPVLIGLFRGKKRGALRGVVKLVALALSILLSVIVTICLRGALTEFLFDFLRNNVLSESLADQLTLVTLIAQILSAAAMVVLYLPIFTVVRLLMLIPEKLISSNLPKKLEDFHAKKQIAKSTASSAETNNTLVGDAAITPAEDVSVSAEQPAVTKPSTGKKILWNTSAMLCGALTSLLFFSVLLIPMAGFITRGGNTVYQVSEVMKEEGIDEYTEEISLIAQSASTAPLFSVPDFLLGKVVFEPLTTISTEHGAISLTKELNIVTELVCNALPAVIHMNEEGTISKQDAKSLANAVETVAQSDLLLTLGTLGAELAGDALEDSDKFSDTEAQLALKSEVVYLLSDTDPETLSEDLETAADLTKAIAGSTILKALMQADQDPDPADLMDRTAMRECFGILYDNDHTKSLLVPLINLGTEIIFQSMGATPVLSTADINDLSREQILAEADRLCDVAENISSFTASTQVEDSKLADYEMVAAGKALDALKESVLFGGQYPEIVKAVTSASGSNENSALMESLGDAIVESESAEKLMNSAQNVVIMSDALEDSTSKGRNDQKLVSALDVLLNHTSPKDADALSGIAGEHFFDGKNNLDNDTKQQILEDSIKAMSAVCERGAKDVEIEADAVQIFRDLTESKSSNIFAEVSEKKTVDTFLESELAMEMLKNLNAENRDYGLRAKLTLANKVKLSSALESSNADEARKQIVRQFFGLN